LVVSWPALSLVAPDVALAIDEIEGCQGPLLDAELSLADNVTAARIRELKAGRTSARLAIRYLGAESAPILATTHGAPIWPTGLCGSLSHSYRWVAALVARSSHYDSVGIDICDRRPLDAAALAGVASADELQVIDRAALISQGISPAAVAFSAKEAIFKCQYPLTLDSSLDFLDVELLRGAQPGSLGARAVGPGRGGLNEIVRRMTIHLAQIQEVTVLYSFLGKSPEGNV
jgi:enterobactin synthetase component D